MSAVNPVCLMDTRAGGQTVDGLGSGIGRRGVGSETPLQISARGPFAERMTVVLTVMHLIADAVAEQRTPADGSLVGRTRGVVPTRLTDTRADGVTVDGAGAGIGKPTAGSVTRVQVRGRGPAGNDVGVAKVTVTVTEPEAAGFVTVWPCDDSRPLASNLNHEPGATVANLVSSAVDADGGICIYTLAATHLVVDLNAVYGRSDAPV